MQSCTLAAGCSRPAQRTVVVHPPVLSRERSRLPSSSSTQVRKSHSRRATSCRKRPGGLVVPTRRAWAAHAKSVRISASVFLTHPRSLACLNRAANRHGAFRSSTVTLFRSGAFARVRAPAGSAARAGFWCSDLREESFLCSLGGADSVVDCVFRGADRLPHSRLTSTGLPKRLSLS